MKNVNVRFSEVVYDKTMPLCYVGKTPKINDNFNSELCNREIMRFVNENYKTNFGFLKHSKNDDSFLFFIFY